MADLNIFKPGDGINCNKLNENFEMVRKEVNSNEAALGRLDENSLRKDGSNLTPEIINDFKSEQPVMLTTSGDITLKDNESYFLSLTDNGKIILPVISADQLSHTITVIVAGSEYSLDLGTTAHLAQTRTGGLDTQQPYSILYIYNKIDQKWYYCLTQQEYLMLQKTFFRVNADYIIEETLLLDKNTIGSYSLTIPEKYNYVVIEYAGASGGRSYITAVSPGRGSILNKKILLKNHSISGIVGQQGEGGSNVNVKGGSGYESGQNGLRVMSGNVYYAGGGGGGSTSVSVNGTIYQASGGSGGADGAAYGGRGGGPYGGPLTTNTGRDATDPGRIGNNSGNGYVKIWAGYDPHFKG